ncbi:MAG: GNAT family N-acetyltransferase, partial [Thermomicrobiales bacterium]
MTDLKVPFPYRARPASMKDLDLVVDFFNICEIDESGVPDYELEEVRSEWEEQDLARNTLLVVDPDNGVVGSMDVKPRAESVFEAAGYTHPAHRNRGIGSFLIGWSEQRALEDPSEAESQTVVRNWVATRNEHAAKLLRCNGYHMAKRFLRMGIELDSAPSPPELPPGYEFREVVVDRDISGIYELVDEAFSEHWSAHRRTFDEWRDVALGFGYSPTFWTQIYCNDERVAVAIGHDLAGLGWIKWVGVRKSHRGRGLGKALLHQQFAHFWHQGLTKIDLGVDTENVTGAVALYERAGMSVKNSYDAW